MTRLFSQEKVWEIELEAYGRGKREEGRKEGLAEGRNEGRLEEWVETLRRLLQKFSILEVSQIMGIFSSLEQNHGADQRCCKQGGLTIFSKEENSQKIFSLPNSLARTGFFQKPVYGVRTCSHHPSRNIILCICI